MAAKDTNPNGRKVIPARELVKIINSLNTVREDISELAGTVGEALKTIAEKYGADRQVIRLGAGLIRKTPEKLARWKEDFDHMWDASGLAERAASAPTLGIGEPGDQADKTEMEADESEQDKAAARRGKVVRAFPAPVGAATE